MASANFIVTTLPEYVANNKDVILKNFGLVGTDTRKRISLVTGVKGKINLNFLDLAPVFQSGVECGFTPQGDATLTYKEAEVAPIKVDMDICPRNLLGKFAEYLVRINATENELPFEKYIMDGVTAEVNKGIEKLIWQGDKSASTDASKKWIDGFIKQMNADASVVDVTLSGNAYDDILSVYGAMSEEALERGGEIYVSPAIYRAFLQELVANNYFHYAGPNDNYPNEYILPGTDVKVVKTAGLKGRDEIVGTFAKNLAYLCDMEGDNEDIDLWFSKDDRVFKMEVLFACGASYYFGEHVVLGQLS